MRLFFTLLFFCTCCKGFTQWSANASVAKNLIADSIDRETSMRTVTDNNGGAYILYVKNNSLLMQRVNEKGITQFAIPVILKSSDSKYYDMDIISDGNSNAIVSYCVENDHVVAVQKININGIKLWGDSGVTVYANASYLVTTPFIINNGADDYYIGWLEIGKNLNNVKAQKINSNGAILWPVNGIYIYANSNQNQINLQPAPDGMGGIIILYNGYNSLTNVSGIYGQRIDGDGSLLWGNEGKFMVDTASGASFSAATGNKHLIPDGKGGAFFVYEGFVPDSLVYVIKAQRINSMGERIWDKHGITVSEVGNGGGAETLISDSDDGINVIWTQIPLNISVADIFVQGISGDGIIRWQQNGIQITHTNQSSGPSGTTDSQGNTIFTWNTNGNNLYAQEINSITGAIQWQVGGRPVCTVTGSFPEDPQITYSPPTGTIVAWIDRWATTAPGAAVSRLYAERIGPDKLPVMPGNSSGIVIYPNPVKDNLNVQFESAPGSTIAYFQIFDDIGRLLLNKSINLNGSAVNQQTIYVGFLPKAVYLLKIVFNNKFTSTKWIKE